MLRLIFFVFLVFSSLSGLCSAREMAEPDISLIMQKAREDAEQMTLPIKKYAEEGLEAAQQAAELYKSPEFQERIQCEQQRLEEVVFGEYIAPWKKGLQVPTTPQGSLTDTEKIYLFLSSSVPDETVHAYISIIARLEDSEVIPMMRGFIGGMGDVKVTTQYFSRILKKDLGCQDIRKDSPVICPRYQVTVQLGSPLFTEFSINQVPALVYLDDNSRKSFVIQGDAGLDYLLEQINREAKSPGIDSLIAKIRSEQ